MSEFVFSWDVFVAGQPKMICKIAILCRAFGTPAALTP